MANPQKENGHVDIANEIMDKLCCYRIPGEVRQVMDTVFRKTYGWNKKIDRISLSQFAGATGLHKPNVVRALSKAIKHEIIRSDNGWYSIQKDTDRWIPFSANGNGGSLANLDEGFHLFEDPTNAYKRKDTRQRCQKKYGKNYVVILAQV